MLVLPLMMSYSKDLEGNICLFTGPAMPVSWGLSSLEVVETWNLVRENCRSSSNAEAPRQYICTYRSDSIFVVERFADTFLTSSLCLRACACVCFFAGFLALAACSHTCKCSDDHLHSSSL